MRIKPRRKQSRIHLALVAALPCAVCGTRPVEVHHIRNGYGMGQRASDLETLPLCPAHHRTGQEAFHAGPRLFAERFGSERELLDKVTIILHSQLDNTAIRSDTGAKEALCPPSPAPSRISAPSSPHSLGCSPPAMTVSPGIPPSPPEPDILDCPDDCPGCLICAEDQSPSAMGWVGKDGRP